MTQIFTLNLRVVVFFFSFLVLPVYVQGGSFGSFTHLLSFLSLLSSPL